MKSLVPLWAEWRAYFSIGSKYFQFECGEKLLECCLRSASPFSSWTIVTQSFDIWCVKEFVLLLRGGTFFSILVFQPNGPSCAVNTLVYRLITQKATVAPHCGKSSSGWHLGSLWTLTGWGNLFPSWNLVSEEYTDTIWDFFFFSLFVVVQYFAVQIRIWNCLLWVVTFLWERAHERYTLTINTS